MRYISTRGTAPALNFSDVILTGLAMDGGLYVPETYPQLMASDFRRFRDMSYTQVAYQVMRPYVGDCIAPQVLKNILEESYKGFADTQVAPVRKLQDCADNGQQLFVCELFYGPTIAFKDFALQVLGRVFDTVLEQRNQRVTIVGATSGDTGSAAIEACKNRQNIDIFILHPLGKTSVVQRKQMTTVDSPNVRNIAIKGTFDDCQNLVKAMFNDHQMRSRLNLSAVNSINWARIMAQVVYYIYSATRLGVPDTKVSFSVPTGNFGNVLAGYFAMRMGLPVDQFMVASNANDILTRYFSNRDMSMQQVIETYSPSMDIQISSNFERLIFESLERDGRRVAQIMQTFYDTGKMPVDEAMWANMTAKFQGYSLTNEQTVTAMTKWHKITGKVFDPHSVIGVEAGSVMKTHSPVICMATAHPAKFPEVVTTALSGTGIKVPDLPAHMQGLMDKDEVYDTLDNAYGVVTDYITTACGV